MHCLNRLADVVEGKDEELERALRDQDRRLMFAGMVDKAVRIAYLLVFLLIVFVASGFVILYWDPLEIGDTVNQWRGQ